MNERYKPLFLRLMKGEEVAGEKQASKILWELRRYCSVKYSSKPMPHAPKGTKIFFMSEVDLAINNDNPRLQETINNAKNKNKAPVGKRGLAGKALQE